MLVHTRYEHKSKAVIDGMLLSELKRDVELSVVPVEKIPWPAAGAS